MKAIIPVFLLSTIACGSPLKIVFHDSFKGSEETVEAEIYSIVEYFVEKENLEYGEFTHNMVVWVKQESFTVDGQSARGSARGRLITINWDSRKDPVGTLIHELLHRKLFLENKTGDYLDEEKGSVHNHSAKFMSRAERLRQEYVRVNIAIEVKE